MGFPYFYPLTANPTRWSNTLKQFVGNLPTNCLSVFDHFVILALKGLIIIVFSVLAFDVVILNLVPISFPSKEKKKST